MLQGKYLVLPLTFWVLSPSDILQYLLKYPNVLRFLYILTLRHDLIKICHDIFRGRLLIALRTSISVSFPSEISDTSNLFKDCNFKDISISKEVWTDSIYFCSNIFMFQMIQSIYSLLIWKDTRSYFQCDP